jgi:hypothetical protein
MSRSVRPLTRIVIQAPRSATTQTSRTTPIASVGTLTSFSPDRSSTALSAPLRNRVGAYEETIEPISTPGMLPMRMEAVSPSLKSPNRMCAIAAAPTMGIA